MIPAGVNNQARGIEVKEAGGGWKAAVLIALLIWGFYFFSTTRSSLWDRDEPGYARATVEMTETGNYLVPRLNGQLKFDKPILIYWLMSVPVRIFGPTEFACRFWSPVGIAISCILTFYIGKCFFGTRAGLLAMVILATTLLTAVVGGAAIVDAVVLPLALAAIAVFVYSLTTGVRLRQTILMGTALGAGMLAKGPIGLLPVPVIIVTLWLVRKVKEGIGKYLLQLMIALIIGVVIFLLWAIPANISTGGEFLKTFLGRDVFGRALRPLEHHGGNFLLYLFYYVPVVLIGFFPWTLHLTGGFSATATGQIGGKYWRPLLTAWVGSIFIIMSLAATKLPHYILLIWPALSLAAAGTITAAKGNNLTDRDKAWLRRGVWFFGPPAIALAAGLMAGIWFLKIPGLQWPCFVSGLVLLAGTVCAIYEQQRGHAWSSARVLITGMAVFGILVFTWVVPSLEEIKITPTIARAVKEKTGNGVPVATYKYAEPSLNFYIGRYIEALRSEEEVVKWSDELKGGVLIIPEDVLGKIQKDYGKLPLERFASKRGINYSKGKEQDVLALMRKKVVQ